MVSIKAATQLLLISLLFCILSCGAQSQTLPHNSTQACSAPEYRQLDFWVGDWDVFDDNGRLQGHNLVWKVLDGCALQEYYIDVSGLKATSFSMYDFTRKLWNQTYISTRGTLLPVEGYLQGKSMIMTGMHVSHDDGRWALHRMIWTPNEDGTAYQLWDFSRDGGKTWTTIYEGYLRKAKSPFPLNQFEINHAK